MLKQACEYPAQSVIGELNGRHAAHQITALETSSALSRALSGTEAHAQQYGVYVGVDPTAASLHVGNLLQLVSLARFSAWGFQPVVVIGGATGRIGDPSGKGEERELAIVERVERNAARLTQLVQRLMPSASVLNNLQWMRDMSALEFLRDVGKPFGVASMLSKESVRQRLASNQGLSFAEFSYQLLQAYDFYYLNRHHNVAVQLGGSDQWGNIVAGVEYARRRAAAGERREMLGLTLPLLLGADGQKLGKSAGNAPVWLSADMTSAFEFFQYFVQLSDDAALRMLPMLSFLSLQECAAVAADHQRNPDSRPAQFALARSVTDFVHGRDATQAVERASAVLFGETIDASDAAALEATLNHMPLVRVSRREFVGSALLQQLVEHKLCASKAAARTLIRGGGCYVAGKRVTDVGHRIESDDLTLNKFCVLRSGKKKFTICKID